MIKDQSSDGLIALSLINKIYQSIYQSFSTKITQVFTELEQLEADCYHYQRLIDEANIEIEALEDEPDFNSEQIDKLQAVIDEYESILSEIESNLADQASTISNYKNIVCQEWTNFQLSNLSTTSSKNPTKKAKNF